MCDLVSVGPTPSVSSARRALGVALYRLPAGLISFIM